MENGRQVNLLNLCFFSPAHRLGNDRSASQTMTTFPTVSIYLALLLIDPRLLTLLTVCAL